jgi:branched-chain amino acid transport system ATP-binding protein
MILLTVENLCKSFGGVRANSDISLTIEEGKIASVIGPNGAGKTTLFNLITGFYPPDKGTVWFQGEDITRVRTEKIASLGLVRTFQHTKVFRDLTVREAVVIGQHIHRKTGLIDAVLASGKARREHRECREKARETIDFIGLSERENVFSRNLPYGEQKLLGIAIALSARPKLLLLDEPAAGMNIAETERLMETIRKLKQSGITTCIVEHNVRMVMRISEKVFVLNYGELLAEGAPEEIVNNPKVIESYLGKSTDAGIE